MRPIRYDKREIEKYVREGYWDKTILPDYWDKNARDWPDKEAVADSVGSRLSWAEAKQRIDRIALAMVKDLKFNRDDRLVVQLPNCVEQVLVRLACEKAGITFLGGRGIFTRSKGLHSMISSETSHDKKTLYQKTVKMQIQVRK